MLVVQLLLPYGTVCPKLQTFFFFKILCFYEIKIIVLLRRLVPRQFLLVKFKRERGHSGRQSQVQERNALVQGLQSYNSASNPRKSLSKN